MYLHQKLLDLEVLTHLLLRILVLNNLKDFWSTEELEIIHKLLLFIDNSKDEIEKKTYISIINTNIITMKENKVREYILKYNMPCN